jgi:hypothetical protein
MKISRFSRVRSLHFTSLEVGTVFSFVIKPYEVLMKVQKLPPLDEGPDEDAYVDLQTAEVHRYIENAGGQVYVYNDAELHI